MEDGLNFLSFSEKLNFTNCCGKTLLKSQLITKHCAFYRQKYLWLSSCEKQFTPNCFIVQQLATIWKAPALLEYILPTIEFVRFWGFFRGLTKSARGWVKKKYTNKLPFYNYFKPNFRHLHEYLSQNWSSDGHFEEVLNSSIY